MINDKWHNDNGDEQGTKSSAFQSTAREDCKYKDPTTVMRVTSQLIRKGEKGRGKFLITSTVQCLVHYTAIV